LWKLEDFGWKKGEGREERWRFLIYLLGYVAYLIKSN
jgi:hypothetical protein